MNSWLLLACAVAFEIAGTTAMKLSAGFTKFWPSLTLFVCYGLAFTALTFALRGIDLGVAYAVWSGVGTALIAIIGVALFHESMDWIKAGSLLLVIAGVMGLNLGGSSR